MGTAKRDRQKANRQLKLEQMHQQAKRNKTKRNLLRFGIGIPLAVGLVWGLAWLVSDDDEDVATSTPPTSVLTPENTLPLDPGTTVPNEPDTTIDPDATAPTDSTEPTESTEPIPTTECPPTDGSATQQREFAGPPPECIDVTATYTAVVTTNHGEFTITLDAERAPITVNNFVTLARFKYFDDTICHRAIPEFAVQCGDPTGTGTGGPGYTIEDELPEAGEYQIGSIAMANTGQPNSGGSQFFIITGDNGAALPPSYSLFGEVTDGLDTTVAALNALGNNENNGVPPLEEIQILSIVITES